MSTTLSTALGGGVALYRGRSLIFDITPLGIGKVELEDGQRVCGFICEGYGVEGAQEITQFGGWRGYLATLAS